MNTHSNKQSSFQTERFMVVQLSPAEGRQLVEALLQDDALAAQIPWLTEKTPDDALRQAYGIEQQLAAGLLKMWGITARYPEIQVGAILAKNSRKGIDVEVMVASQYWGDDGVVQEACEPVLDWIDDNVLDMLQNFPLYLH